MSGVIIEIRAAEGGAAKLLVRDQVSIYSQFALRRGLDLDLLEEQSGMVVLRVTGKTADADFALEGGGHRFQRVPPTEKHGRRQTSTITVAVLREPTEVEVRLAEKDLEWQATRGSGAGGQARNKTSSAVILKHKPSGLMVRVESERSQNSNLQAAKALLRARLLEQQVEKVQSQRNNTRKQQVGAGCRGDKIRTTSVFRDQTVDHRTNKTTTAERYYRGFLEDLW